MLSERTVFCSAESGGATQARVPGRRRAHRERKRREEDGRGQQWAPARLGGRRRPEHLEEATLAISLTACMLQLRLGRETTTPRAAGVKPGTRRRRGKDDVGGQRGATAPGIVRSTRPRPLLGSRKWLKRTRRNPTHTKG